MKALMIVGLVMALFAATVAQAFDNSDLAELEMQNEIAASPRLDKCTRGSDTRAYAQCQHLLLRRGCSQLSAKMVVERLNSPESSTEDKKLVLALRTPEWQRTPDQQTFINMRSPFLIAEQQIKDTVCFQMFYGHEDELITELTTSSAEKEAAKAKDKAKQSAAPLQPAEYQARIKYCNKLATKMVVDWPKQFHIKPTADYSQEDEANAKDFVYTSCMASDDVIPLDLDVVPSPSAAPAKNKKRQQTAQPPQQVITDDDMQARAECIRNGDTAAGKADVWSAAHPSAKQFTEVELRGLSDKVYGNCMGTPGVKSGNDNMELEPNRQGRFITRVEACGKQIDKDKIVGMDMRSAAMEQCMGKTFPVDRPVDKLAEDDSPAVRELLLGTPGHQHEAEVEAARKIMTHCMGYAANLLPDMDLYLDHQVQMGDKNAANPTNRLKAKHAFYKEKMDQCVNESTVNGIKLGDVKTK
jgi:hypothetical protein